LSVVRPRDRAAQLGRERTSLTANGILGWPGLALGAARLWRTGPPGRARFPAQLTASAEMVPRSRPARTPAPGAVHHRALAPSGRTGRGGACVNRRRASVAACQAGERHLHEADPKEAIRRPVRPHPARSTWPRRSPARSQLPHMPK
jgi:hypothetical protein